MNILRLMFIIWTLLVSAYVALLVYRGQLSNHETDQLFLTDNPADIQVEEQNRVIGSLTRIQPFCTAMGVLAAVATVALIGIYVAEQTQYLH